MSKFVFWPLWADSPIVLDVPPIRDSDSDESWSERCKGKFNSPMEFRGFPRSPVSACDTCTNEGSCRRIGECLRYKCPFGSVDKP
jgi:hypothetical protein